MFFPRGKILLAPLTTFKIGGPSQYYFQAENKPDLIEAIKWAKQKETPFFILGSGSNILVSDQGFKGLVIKCQMSAIKCQKQGLIYAGAGLPLNKLLEFSIKKGLAGLECLVGIPGTLGGAIRGNAGAFNHSISDFIKKVEVFNSKTLKVEEKDVKECKFAYRESIFKQRKDLIILGAEIQLEKGKREESKNKIRGYLQKRRKTQPKEPSAGCIFKNPPGLSAGWLIEQCGLKGFQLGKAEVSKQHADFIVNHKKATAQQVMGLIDFIKRKVKAKFGLDLEEEIEYVGFVPRGKRGH